MIGSSRETAAKAVKAQRKQERIGSITDPNNILAGFVGGLSGLPGLWVAFQAWCLRFPQGDCGKNRKGSKKTGAGPRKQERNDGRCAALAMPFQLGALGHAVSTWGAFRSSLVARQPFTPLGHAFSTWCASGCRSPARCASWPCCFNLVCPKAMLYKRGKTIANANSKT